jgi:2-polyprenyl-3-methyl-5-hydroxy-6-metoxy-1,4-benzoquinol methylase
MLRTPGELREFTSKLAFETWTLSAIAALYESGLAEHLREPRSIDELATCCRALSRSRIERCVDIASAAGVVVTEGSKHRLAEGALPFSHEPMRTALTGDLRTHLLQALHYLDTMRGGERTKGWQHTDEAILQSQGASSIAIASIIKMMIAPKLGDLAARLEQPGARFLDIGVGVGSLAIAMVRMFENLSVVGVDVHEPALALARENVKRAKLEDRIELRKCAIEDLRDDGAFTLAWLPGFFIADIEGAIARIHASLAPGGFILCALAASTANDPRVRSVWSLINDEWGGSRLTAPEVEALLTRIGFQEVRTLPGPASAPPMVVGKR